MPAGQVITSQVISELMLGMRDHLLFYSGTLEAFEMTMVNQHHLFCLTPSIQGFRSSVNTVLPS